MHLLDNVHKDATIVSSWIVHGRSLNPQGVSPHFLDGKKKPVFVLS